MVSPWFKMPSDLMQDCRFFGLSVANQRHYFCLLMAKSGGLLDQDMDGCDADFAQTAREALITNFLNVGKAQAARIKHALLRSGLIDEDWQPVQWEERYGPDAYRHAQQDKQERQTKSSTERSRECRARKANTLGDCNADATDMQRDCNADATATLMQRTCNATATLMQRTCNATATLMQRTNVTFPLYLMKKKK